MRNQKTRYLIYRRKNVMSGKEQEPTAMVAVTGLNEF